MRVFSVIVSFNPDVRALVSLCRTLRACNSGIVIIDNSDVDGLAEKMEGADCTVVWMHGNVGIARAQNVGIEVAVRLGADVVAFFDQDSDPTADLLTRLLDPLERGKPGVVAPVCVDARSGEEMPSFRVDRFGLVRGVFAGNRTMPFEVDLVISSGTAATVQTFEVAGKMDERLFIDYVDFEWCFRCRARGIPIRVVPGTAMKHSIGERAVSLGFFNGVIHGPARSYYKIRNCLLLFRKADVPVLYSGWETLTAIVRYVLLMAHVDDKGRYGRVLLSALLDGAKGLSGKNPRASP